jgi:hypothetical protein
MSNVYDFELSKKAKQLKKDFNNRPKGETENQAMERICNSLQRVDKLIAELKQMQETATK